MQLLVVMSDPKGMVHFGLTLTKLNNFNRFVLIVNFHNCFVEALTEIFMFRRALVHLLDVQLSVDLRGKVVW